MQIKVEQVHLFSILVTWYDFLARTSNQPDPPKNCMKDGWALSNLEESQYSCLPPQASILVEIHPRRLPYFTLGTSKDINNPKSASRASSSNHHSRSRGVGSLSINGFKAQEKKAMVSGGIERFQ
ncbi:hypothetical protein O181_084027 [Austropuccinia psidii MF-1]|uniref:Uncharacterized protein n=1 Tax=Austropuccinia psidii MF-1 TaxID=1389203 RepID=A0A9Q3FTF4_9BASI|nr:hypothetical protein [Austropuccinia psidii MF-1]